HRDEQRAVLTVGARVVDLYDPGMAHLGRDARLALEADLARLALSDAGMDQLQRDALSGDLVLRFVHRSHRAAAELAEDAILAGDDASEILLNPAPRGDFLGQASDTLSLGADFF